MSEKLYLIGNKEDYKQYELNTNNIDALPIANLPMSYFPFFYGTSENSLEKMKKLVPLVANNKISNGDGHIAQNTVDTDKLFSLLTTLEEGYQPFNNNNIFHITIVIGIVWFIILIAILKIIYYFLKDKYSYFILFMILLLLVISTLWALVVTAKSFK